MLNSLDPDFSTEQAEAFRHDSFARIVQNAVSAQGADEVSLDRETVNAHRRIHVRALGRLESYRSEEVRPVLGVRGAQRDAGADHCRAWGGGLRVFGELRGLLRQARKG